MDSNCAEGKILYFWDEYNIFIYIIPALLFFLLLSPVIRSDSFLSTKIVGVLSEIDSRRWPLALLYVFVISCILYIVGNVIASFNTAVLGRIVSIESIGDPNVVSLTGWSQEPFAVKLRVQIFLVDVAFFILTLPLIFKFKPAIRIIFIGLCLWMVFIFIDILKNIGRDRNNVEKVNTRNDSKRFIGKFLDLKRKLLKNISFGVSSFVDKLLKIILGSLPKEIKEAFEENFKDTFNITKEGDKSTKIKNSGEVKYDFGLPLTYIQNNHPSVFLRIKRYHMLFSFSQNVTGSFLFALLFYITFYLFTDLDVSKSSPIIRWWGVGVWSIGNVFLMRYLRTYYNTYYRYIIKAFVALQSSKEENETKKS